MFRGRGGIFFFIGHHIVRHWAWGLCSPREGPPSNCETLCWIGCVGAVDGHPVVDLLQSLPGVVATCGPDRLWRTRRRSRRQQHTACHVQAALVCASVENVPEYTPKKDQTGKFTSTSACTPAQHLLSTADLDPNANVWIPRLLPAWVLTRSKVPKSTVQKVVSDSNLNSCENDRENDAESKQRCNSTMRHLARPRPAGAC